VFDQKISPQVQYQRRREDEAKFFEGSSRFHCEV
jgi:hypothetical protein